MPKYELMYIIGNSVSETDIPEVIEEVKKYITEFGGNILKHEEIGKKKLSYPIKRIRNAYYVLVQFEGEAEKLFETEKRIQTNQEVIRYLILNMDEALVRMENDRKIQSKMKPRREDDTPKPTPTKPKPDKKIEIDLDAEIEKALESEDLK